MSAALSTIEDLERVIKSRPSSERDQVLRAVAGLFVSGIGHHSDAQIALFDELLCRLMKYAERRALAQLSSDLGTHVSAPVRVVRQLARHDDIAVAGPVLSGSDLITTDDLVEIARTKDQDHLLAIVDRPVLDEAVSDVLVERGHTEVARRVAASGGARFSTSALARLLTRAETETGLAEAVAARPEVSSDQLRHLLLRATEMVRTRLIAITKPETKARIEKVLLDIAAEIDRPDTERRDYSTAQQVVLSVRSDPAAMSAMLANAAAQGDFEMTVSLLSALGGVPLDAVERKMNNSNEGDLLLLCKAINLPWKTVRAVLALHPSGPRDAHMQKTQKQFEGIDVATAQRVLRFWQARERAAAPAHADECQSSLEPSGE